MISTFDGSKSQKILDIRPKTSLDRHKTSANGDLVPTLGSSVRSGGVDKRFYVDKMPKKTKQICVESMHETNSITSDQSQENSNEE